MISLCALLIIGFFVWLWQAAARAKEVAINAAQNACNEQELQFLDDTTHLVKIRLAKSANGHIAFHRYYQFDYYNGEQRNNSTVIIANHQVVSLIFPDKPTQQRTRSSNIIHFPKKK